jgi:hypothetical protein
VRALRVEIQASEVEVDRVAEVLPVAVAAGHALDRLDLAVDRLGEGVGHVAGGGVLHTLLS